MLVTRGMGTNGVLATAGFGYDSYLEVVVVVQPTQPKLNPSGGTGRVRHVAERKRHRFIVDQFNREEIIARAVREDEELVAIVITAIEALNGIT